MKKIIGVILVLLLALLVYFFMTLAPHMIVLGDPLAVWGFIISAGLLLIGILVRVLNWSFGVRETT